MARWAWLFSSTFALLCIACEERARPTSDASAAPSIAAVTAAPFAKRPLHASGATGELFRAVERLSLQDGARRKLDDLAAEMHDAEAAARGSAGDAGALDTALLHAMLVAGVRAGKVDAAAIDAAIAKMARIEDAARERDARALNAVHALLDASQRAAAVAGARASDKRGGRGRKPPPVSDAARVNMARLKFEAWAHDLELDADQRMRLAGILPKDDAAADDDDEETTRDALFAAFEKEDFDARKLDVRDATKRRLAPFMATVMFLDHFVPILRPDQRDRLATTLEKSAERR